MTVVRWMCLAAFLAGAGCAADEGAGVPSVPSGPQTPPAGRQVMEGDALVYSVDAGDLRAPGASGGPISGSAVPGPDASTSGGDVRRDATAPSPTGCSLLAQDCEPRAGCYPGPNGTGACKPRGSSPETTPCFADEQCDRGLLCVDPQMLGSPRCARICDPAVIGACGRGATCRAFPGSTIGTCAG